MDYMELAAQEAEKNLKTGDGGPFGCVIIKNGEIIAQAHNQVLVDHDPTAHAEITAIRQATKKLGTHDLSDCIVYTSCYPCPMCLGALIWANVEKVYYGNTAKDAAHIGFRDDFIYDFIKGDASDVNVLPLEQMEHDKTIQSFNSFMDMQDKQLY